VRAILLLILIGALASGGAQAEPDAMARRPAAELLAACEAVPTGGPEATRCLAFVEGFLWGHGWAAWRTSRDMYFCPPGEEGVAAPRDMIPAIVAYLEAHRDKLDQPAHLMLFSALSSAYPCTAPDPSAGR
jgi:hypothetical protein